MLVAVAAAEESASSEDVGRRAPLIGEDFNCDCHYLPHFIFTVATLSFVSLATDYEYFVYLLRTLCFLFSKFLLATALAII